jgi:hypothetical protein
MARGIQSRAQAARLRWAVVTGLRRWAQGSLADEAAVELLASYPGGRFARPGRVWIRPCARPGWYWLDSDALAVHAERLAGSERRVLLLAADLVSGHRRTRARAESGRAAA